MAHVGRAKYGLILHCRAGCSYESILAALAMQGIDPRHFRKATAGADHEAAGDSDADDEEADDAKGELDNVLAADDQATPLREGAGTRGAADADSANAAG